ncbi:FkbM family methyltransferase [Pseudomonadota bacterium]
MIATQEQKADAIEPVNMKIAEGEEFFNQGDIDSAVPAPCLLKIDVDGHEIPILEGDRETLKNVFVVVIEATAGSFLERANFL